MGEGAAGEHLVCAVCVGPWERGVGVMLLLAMGLGDIKIKVWCRLKLRWDGSDRQGV